MEMWITVMFLQVCFGSQCYFDTQMFDVSDTPKLSLINCRKNGHKHLGPEVKQWRCSTTQFKGGEYVLIKEIELEVMGDNLESCHANLKEKQ